MEIGIYKSYNKYFARGISGYKMKEICNEDKYCLAFKIRNKLNEKKIEFCFIRSLNLSSNGFLGASKDDLEAIASAMSFNTNNKKLEIKINYKELYEKRRNRKGVN